MQAAQPSRGRRVKLACGALLVAVVALAVVDATPAPGTQRGAALAVAGIRAYQRTFGPLLGTTCRFTPTCSHYAEAVIRDFGLATGSWLAVRRLARCGPWTARGTSDPPPQPTAAAAVSPRLTESRYGPRRGSWERTVG